MDINEIPPYQQLSSKHRILPCVRIFLSLIAAVVGYLSPDAPDLPARLLASYLGWSWFWGLVLLWPRFIKTVLAWGVYVGLFFWLPFYSAQSMLFGFLGGGIYLFIKDVATAVSPPRLVPRLAPFPPQKPRLHICCPKCGKPCLRGATTDMIGKSGVCKRCGHEFVITDPKKTAP